jgi:hypothetical protein
MTEVFYTAAAGRSHGKGTTLVVAPGVSCSDGRGWEFAIEAMIPTKKATGSGIGVVAQLVIQFDYLPPDSILDRPIFLAALSRTGFDRRDHVSTAGRSPPLPWVRSRPVRVRR